MLLPGRLDVAAVAVVSVVAVPISPTAFKMFIFC